MPPQPISAPSPYRPPHRQMTRQERYLSKNAKTFNFSVCGINFLQEHNVGVLLRSAACFGAKNFYMIGDCTYENLQRTSGTLNKFLPVTKFPNPIQFLQYTRQNNIYVCAVELADQAISIYDLNPPMDQEVCFVLGHEETGVPEDIIQRANELVYIPLPGVGYCLNVSACGAIVISEYIRKINT